MKNKQLRILHLYRRFMPDFTGDGIYYSRLIPLMAAHNTSHAVLVTETKENGLPAGMDGTTVHYLVVNKKQDVGMLDLHWWLLSNASQFDILHIHTHVSWRFSAYILVRLLGKSVIFSCSLEDSPGDLILAYRASVRKIASLMMRSIQVFVAISPRLYLMSLKSISSERVENIPQGVLDTYANADNLAIRQKVRRQWGLHEDDVLLLSVGSICDRKNTLFFIETLRCISNPKVKLILVGTELEPEYAAQVNKLISTYDLSNRVVQVGFSATPDIFYKTCDILVFSSKAEGFSNVYLEAMCHALPVVTLYLPGLVDYLFDYGETGYFSRDLPTFVGHVKSLVDNPSLREKIGKQGRKYVLRHYGLDQIAKLYVSLYQRVAGYPAIQFVSDGEKRLPAIVDCTMVAAGPKAMGLLPIDMRKDIAPLLCIVIDTESEFDWSLGVGDDTGRVTAIAELPALVSQLVALQAAPCLVLDYPVATHESTRSVVSAMARQGVELGLHLQPWTTPPFAEPQDAVHSFSGNLGPMFERTKLSLLKEAVQALTTAPVRTFKSGRYGASASTFKVMASLGVDIDLSISPGFDFSREGGPDWRRYRNGPAWVGLEGGVLEVPTTAGFNGPGCWLAGSPPGNSSIVALLRKGHLAHAQRLSPEGGSLKELKFLTNTLHADGLRVFTLSFHSPSLKPNCTPYTKTAEDVQDFIKTIIGYVEFFKKEYGGRVVLPSELRALIESGAITNRHHTA